MDFKNIKDPGSLGLITGLHTCQVLGKSKSEIACTPLIFAYNLAI